MMFLMVMMITTLEILQQQSSSSHGYSEDWRVVVLCPNAAIGIRNPLEFTH